MTGVLDIRTNDVIMHGGRSWRVISAAEGNEGQESAVEIVALDRLAPSGAGWPANPAMVVPLALIDPTWIFRSIQEGWESSALGQRKSDPDRKS